MTAITFSGAADWFAGTHAGTHHEVWAGNSSNATLTMGYAPKMPLAYGSHTWFGGPRAFTDVSRGVTLYPVVSLGTTIHLGVTEVNHTTGARTHVEIATDAVPATDNHYVLSIYKRADNKYVLMWGFHDNDNTLRWYVSSSANSIASWGAVKTKATGFNCAYPIVYRLPGDGNRVVVFMRQQDTDWQYAVSTDDLDTLGNFASFLGAKAGSAHGPYLHAYPDPDNTDRIWFCASDYMVNTPGTHQIDDVVVFYGEWASGSPTFYAPDGTSLGASVAWSELTAGNLGLAHDSSASGNDVWVYDIVVKNSKVYVGYTEMGAVNSGTGYDYKVAVIDYSGAPSLSTGTLWDESVDGTNGALCGSANTNAYVYAAGLAFDRTNPQRAYISFGTGFNDTTNRCKIRLVTTANDWSTKSITTPSFKQGRAHNYHPVMPFVSDYTTAPPSFCEMSFETGYLNSWASVFAMFVLPDWNGAVRAMDLTEPSGTPSDKLTYATVLGTPSKISTPTMGATGVNNGKALTFNGSSTALSTGISHPLARPIVGAIMHWVNISSTSVQQIFGGASDAGSGRKFWGINASNQALLGVGSSSAADADATALTTSAWHHVGILVTLSGSNLKFDWHVNGVSDFTRNDGYAEPGLVSYLGALNTNGTANNWTGGSFCQLVEDWGESRDATWLAAIAGYASAGTFTSGSKTASVTNGPVVGPTLTPSATLPTGASYDIKLISTSTPAGQTKTGTASTPIVFDGVTIADGDTVSIVVTPATSDKTVAPSFTSFSIAA